MDCMCMLPGRGLCMVKSNRVYDYDTALQLFPEWTEAVAGKGEIYEGGKAVGDRFFADPHEVSFYVEALILEDAKKKAVEIGVEYVVDGEFMAYDEQSATEFREWIDSFAHTKKAIPEVMQVETVVLQEPKTEKVLPKVANTVRVAPVVLSQPTTIRVTPEVSERMQVPVVCKGETWAQTFQEVNLKEVTSNVYCIENNWEKRGEYYIIDCIPMGRRFVHSDVRGYDESFDLTECDG